MRTTRSVSLLLCLLIVAVLLPPPVAEAATVPTGFTDVSVTGVPGPTALAFTPDGRMLVATQGGRLRVYQDGALRPTPALDLAAQLCTNSERGLLGVAVDPAFAANRSIYLYYTFNNGGVCVNRVARYTLADDNTVDPASETVLIDNIPSPGGNHNGGDLHFGADGYLYVSVGDGGCDYRDISRCAGANAAARDRTVLLGKVLRVTRDGDIPPTNPYRGADSARCNVAGRTATAAHC